MPATAVREGLQRVVLGAHKIETVSERDGVRFVDDSKATNPHAADAALRAFESVVWIAGGQAKGTDFDDLVQRHRSRLRGAVLLGVDRAVIAESLARHAPEVPVKLIEAVETRAMVQAVAAAVSLAAAGDVVLLAPGCASKDMYSDYAARGDAFVAAVEGLDDSTGNRRTEIERSEPRGHGDPRPNRQRDPSGSGVGSRKGSTKGKGSSGKSAAWVRAVLDRPMTSYQLVLAAAGLLVTLGVLMVLSASSVAAYVDYSRRVLVLQAADLLPGRGGHRCRGGRQAARAERCGCSVGSGSRAPSRC